MTAKMAPIDHSSHVAQFLLHKADTHARSLMEKRSIVAIYHETNSEKIDTAQIGTGFVLQDSGSLILITAKHTLYGHGFDEKPLEKSIFAGGNLRLLASIAESTVTDDGANDLVALRIRKFPDLNGLSVGSLEPNPSRARLLTLAGYLSRDFRRAVTKGVLAPTRYVYSNKRVPDQPGSVAMLHPDFQNRSPGVLAKVRAPLPRGLSGCPMLDTLRLATGHTSIIGVFTDHPTNVRHGNGRSSGVGAAKIFGLLGRLLDQ